MYSSLGPKELINSDSYAPFTDDMVDLKLFSIFDINFKYSEDVFCAFSSKYVDNSIDVLC